MIQTVTGPVAPEQLGMTLPHEHVICGSPLFYRGFGENWVERGRVIAETVRQLKSAAASYGLQTLVDGSPFSLARDVLLLKEVAELSGVRIIASTGYYVTVDFGLSKVPLEIQAEYFTDECRNGLEGTGIRPGCLKCAANGDTPLWGAEVMAMVQAATGLPLYAHSCAHARTGFKLLDIFEKHRLDPAKVVIGHVGDSHDLAYVREILKHGCYVCIDRLSAVADVAAKARIVAGLAELGFLDRILVSHDHICWPVTENKKQKTGREYHMNPIGELLIPELLRIGFDRSGIEQLTVENPKHLFE